MIIDSILAEKKYYRTLLAGSCITKRKEINDDKQQNRGQRNVKECYYVRMPFVLPPFKSRLPVSVVNARRMLGQRKGHKFVGIELWEPSQLIALLFIHLRKFVIYFKL